jgi:methyl-accepting chemotaxis protein
VLSAIANRPIGARLGVAYALFMLPLAFLLYALVSNAARDLGTTRGEIAGARAIAQASALQAEILAAATPPDPAATARRLGAIDFAGVEASELRQAEAALRRNGDDRIGASKILLGLIAKTADASALTLDPDLDSYYVMDAVTARLPALAHELAAMGAALGAPADKRGALHMVQAARAAPLIEALGSDLDTAFKANADGETRKALGGLASTARNRLQQALMSAEAAARDDGIVQRAQAALDQAQGDLSKLRAAGLAEL